MNGWEFAIFTLGEWAFIIGITNIKWDWKTPLVYIYFMLNGISQGN